MNANRRLPPDHAQITNWVRELSHEQCMELNKLCAQLSSGSFPGLAENGLQVFSASQTLLSILAKVQKQNTTSSDNKVVAFIREQLTEKICEHEKQLVSNSPEMIITPQILFSTLLLPEDIVYLLFFQHLTGTDSFNLLRAIPKIFLYKAQQWKFFKREYLSLLGTTGCVIS